ncbi:hypothetical protein CRUP_025769 [Coryphaenoides rupestris]|nr:hypothetical protein CRUP_025769 [Coryphaenoides rupestris]
MEEEEEEEEEGWLPQHTHPGPRGNGLFPRQRRRLGNGPGRNADGLASVTSTSVAAEAVVVMVVLLLFLFRGAVVHSGTSGGAVESLQAAAHQVHVEGSVDATAVGHDAHRGVQAFSWPPAHRLLYASVLQCMGLHAPDIHGESGAAILQHSRPRVHGPKEARPRMASVEAERCGHQNAPQEGASAADHQGVPEDGQDVPGLSARPGGVQPGGHRAAPATTTEYRLLGASEEISSLWRPLSTVQFWYCCSCRWTVWFCSGSTATDTASGGAPGAERRAPPGLEPGQGTLRATQSGPVGSRERYSNLKAIQVVGLGGQRLELDSPSTMRCALATAVPMSFTAVHVVPACILHRHVVDLQASGLDSPVEAGRLPGAHRHVLRPLEQHGSGWEGRDMGVTLGSGCPAGGPQRSTASWPSSTSTSSGCTANSSRSTATHRRQGAVYTPSCVWPPRRPPPAPTLRKNRLPSDSTMTRDRSSRPACVSRGWPLRSHWTVGSGVPWARQDSVVGSPTFTTTSAGWWRMRGTASAPGPGPNAVPKWHDPVSLKNRRRLDEEPLGVRAEEQEDEGKVGVGTGTALGPGPGAEAVPRILHHPADVVVKVGEPTTLSCRAQGTPEPTVQWLRNGQPLETQAGRDDRSRVMVLSDGSLFFLSVGAGGGRRGGQTHEGVYTCVARNGVGVATSRNATLYIAGEEEEEEEEERCVVQLQLTFYDEMRAGDGRADVVHRRARVPACILHRHVVDLQALVWTHQKLADSPGRTVTFSGLWSSTGRAGRDGMGVMGRGGWDSETFDIKQSDDTERRAARLSLTPTVLEATHTYTPECCFSEGSMVTLGSGCPAGGPQRSTASWPSSTSTSSGCTANSSRSTATHRRQGAVALRLVATPTPFRATQVYTPSCVWPPRRPPPAPTLRKNRLPSDSTMTRDRSSRPACVSRGWPLRSHWTVGSGVPWARQDSVVGSPTFTTTSAGWWRMRGTASAPGPGPNAVPVQHREVDEDRSPEKRTRVKTAPGAKTRSRGQDPLQGSRPAPGAKTRSRGQQ